MSPPSAAPALPAAAAAAAAERASDQPSEPAGEPADSLDATSGPAAYGVVSRTWDMELLISGGVVFALLQAPRSIDAAFNRFEPLLAGGARMVLFYLHLYAVMIVYVLIGAFVLHLAARAYWVGMIGLDSVFPHGVRWEHWKSDGPIAREVHQRRVATLPTMIRRVDDFCSVIFPTAFLLVVLFAVSLLTISVAGAVVYVISTFAFGGRYKGLLFNLLLFGFVGSQLLLAWWDRSRGGAMRGRARRAMRRYFDTVATLFAMPLIGPVMLTLMTNVRYRWLYALFVLPIAGAFVADTISDGDLTLSSALYLPDQAGEHGVDYAFYRDQRRSAEAPPLVPWIQSDVVRGPYVALFIPYVPRRHNAAIAAHCPGVRPLHSASLRPTRDEVVSPAAARAVLACLARVQPVLLNGQPLEADFSFYRDPASGARGVLAHIPTAGLPRGRNLLSIVRLPRYTDGVPEPAPPRYTIPFWL